MCTYKHTPLHTDAHKHTPTSHPQTYLYRYPQTCLHTQTPQTHFYRYLQTYLHITFTNTHLQISTDKPPHTDTYKHTSRHLQTHLYTDTHKHIYTPSPTNIPLQSPMPRPGPYKQNLRLRAGTGGKSPDLLGQSHLGLPFF